MSMKELADAVYDAGLGLTRLGATAAAETVFVEIARRLIGGDDMQIYGFGTFKNVHRAARTGHNPKTGDPINIPATNGVKFTPSKALKTAINPPRAAGRQRKRA